MNQSIHGLHWSHLNKADQQLLKGCKGKSHLPIQAQIKEAFQLLTRPKYRHAMIPKICTSEENNQGHLRWRTKTLLLLLNVEDWLSQIKYECVFRIYIDQYIVNRITWSFQKTQNPKKCIARTLQVSSRASLYNYISASVLVYFSRCSFPTFGKHISEAILQRSA